MLSAYVNNVELELNRVKSAKEKMGVEDGGTVARKDRVLQLRSRGEETHARAQEIQFDRFVELERDMLRIYRQRAEVDMGLAAARSQMQELVDRGQTVAIAEEDLPVTPEYRCGLPIAIYNFAVRSDMQKIQRSRTNQREKSSLQRHIWSDWNRYFKR